METSWRRHEPRVLAVDRLALPAGRAVVRVAGELDLASCWQLRDALNAELGAGRSWLVLDLAELSFLDSTGMSVLVEFSKKTSRASGKLALAGLQPQPAKVLKITGLDRSIPVYATAAEAVAETAPAAGTEPSRKGEASAS